MKRRRGSLLRRATKHVSEIIHSKKDHGPKGQNRNWKRYWFVLDPHSMELRWFFHQGGPAQETSRVSCAAGKMVLGECSVGPPEGTTLRTAFSLSNASGNLTLNTVDADQYDLWTATRKEVGKRARDEAEERNFDGSAFDWSAFKATLAKDLAFGMSREEVIRWDQIEVDIQFGDEEGSAPTALVHFLKTKDPGAACG